jgi:putative hydrolase of the HAD superfamily
MQTSDTLIFPKAILFDLDDTLVCYDCLTKPSWQKTCAAFAGRAGLAPQELEEAIRAITSVYWSDPVRHREGRLELEETRRVLVSEALRRKGISSAGLGREIADYYSVLQESMIELFPDALPTIQFFKGRNVKMALVTNGNAAMQRRKISRFRLENFFSHFFIEGELGFGKPDRRVFECALAALSVSPADTWCVGDNLEWDVFGAAQCGIHGIWKDTYRKGPTAGEVRPGRTIYELSELVDRA